MIVEHTFVTTLEHDEAFGAADLLLSPMGFVRAPMPPGETLAAEWRRGDARARKRKLFARLPQRLRLDFDRGRVNLAYALSLPPGVKPHAFVQRYGVGLARSLDAALTGSRDLDDARAEPIALEIEVDLRARRMRLVIVAVALVSFAVVFGLLVWLG